MIISPFRQKRSFFETVCRNLVLALLLVVWAVTFFLVTFCQLLCFIINPHSWTKRRGLQKRLMALWTLFFVFSLKLLFRYKVEYRGDLISNKESALIISNHLEQSDIIILAFVAAAQKIIHCFSWVAKEALDKIPLFSLNARLCGTLFVSGKWEIDRLRIQKKMKELSLGERPLYPVLFVEGSRFRPSRLERSHKFSLERGLPQLDYVLVPRSKGFSAIIQELEGILEAVYDVTIVYPQGVPTLLQYLAGYTPLIYLYVKRYPIAEIPRESEAAFLWLMERYKEKNEFLKNFSRDKGQKT